MHVFALHAGVSEPAVWCVTNGVFSIVRHREYEYPEHTSVALKTITDGELSVTVLLLVTHIYITLQAQVELMYIGVCVIRNMVEEKLKRNGQ